MHPFRLSISFNDFGTLNINNRECILVQIYNPAIVNNLFEWLDSGKYFANAGLEFTSANCKINERLTVQKHFKTIRFRLSGHESDDFYYQQRYNSSGNDDVQDLAAFLGEIGDPFFIDLLKGLNLEILLDEKVNMLSTGEFRKAMIFKKAMEKPDILFIDEPYAGLDELSCKLINMLFDHLVNDGSSLVIFNSTPHRPLNITTVFDAGMPEINIEGNRADGIVIPAPTDDMNFEYAYELKNINASYSGREVLRNIYWSVKRNEKWSLTGRNGAGKSTLLSFIYADNPKAYCNDVWLFGNKRGSGETIWEIKDRIGFYSSELHRYFNKMHTVRSAIDSIVYQNPYEKRVLCSGEEDFRTELLKYFDMEKSMEKRLCDLPVVTQKLTLIAAVMVKNSPVIILDEPFQGFSQQLVSKILPILEKYVENRTFVMVSHNNSDFPVCINKHYHIENGEGKEV